ncbi:CoA transferase subunit A [Pseudonocardia xishanensis]|uniref:CoA transferase subunit A n=1 Tax=Pseudonocardia xishanensis TaxID=630995 RepID=A0ABP8RLP3_9PSEU
MATISALADALDALVRNGSEVAWEGAPVAVATVLARRRVRDLTLVALNPGISGDLLVGAGCVARLVTSAVAGPDGAVLPRIAAADVEREDHTATGLATAYDAGAAGLPFGVLRGYVGTDLATVTRVATVRCPFTGEDLAAVPAIAPDVAIVHARRADRAGNVDGLVGVGRDAVYAARRALVTVSETVEELPRTELPGVAGLLVAEVPESPVPADFAAWLAEVRA